MGQCQLRIQQYQKSARISAISLSGSRRKIGKDFLIYSVGLLEEHGASRARVIGSNPIRSRALSPFREGQGVSLVRILAAGCVG